MIGPVTGVAQTSAPVPGSELTGITGWVSDVVAALGELGVGALTLLEVVLPPVPSEVVLPLAGYLANRGRLDITLTLVAATVGSLIGALLLYAAGARLGIERSARGLARLPLLDRRDVDKAVDWFDRHGPSAVLLGRLVPGVRSLISLPAGATGMPLLRFCLLTAVGSVAWNAALLAAGYALGTQYRLVEQYADVLDRVLVGVLSLLLVLAVARRVRQRAR